MILQSTFTSVPDVARRWLVPRFMVLDPFDTIEVIPTLDAPILIVHGRRDSLIPVSHGERLRDAARNARLPEEADHLLDLAPSLGRLVERHDPLRVVALVGDLDRDPGGGLHARTSAIVSPTMAITSSTSASVMRGKSGSEISLA